jgi:hypothetical protein
MGSRPTIAGVYHSPYGNSIAELLMRQGDIAARGAENKGAIWSQALGQLGQIAGGAVQEHQARKEQKKREEMFGEAMQTWDPANPQAFFDKAALAYGPEFAISGIRALTALEESRRKAEPDPKLLEAKAEFIGRMWRQTPDYVRQNWSSIVGSVPEAQALHGITLGPDWDEEKYAPLLGALIGEEKPIEVSPGASLAVPEAGGFKTAYTAPAKPAEPPKTLEMIEAEAEARARGSRKGAPDSMPTLSPVAESNIINRLSNQWGGAVKSTAEISRQVSLMEKGLEAARRGDLAAGSQAVLVTFQKILDPTSVVRESEYARSAAGQALLARIQGAAEQLQKGGAGVPVGELEKFARLAREMASGQTGYLKAVKERIGKTADRYQIPRELVTEEFDFGVEAQPSAGAGGEWMSVGGVKVRKKAR